MYSWKIEMRKVCPQMRSGAGRHYLNNSQPAVVFLHRYGGGYNMISGMDTDWTTRVNQTCDDWMCNSPACAGMKAAVGYSPGTGGDLLNGGQLSCCTGTSCEGGFLCVTIEGGSAPSPPPPPSPTPTRPLYACVVVGGIDTCEPVGPGTLGVSLAQCQTKCHK